MWLICGLFINLIFRLTEGLGYNNMLKVILSRSGEQYLMRRSQETFAQLAAKVDNLLEKRLKYSKPDRIYHRAIEINFNIKFRLVLLITKAT